MKKKNVFWGVLFLLGACAVIAGRLGFLDGIGFWSILFSLVLAAVLIRGIVRRSWSMILFSVAFLCIVNDRLLGIEELTPWPVLGAAFLGTIGLNLLFPRHGWKNAGWHRIGMKNGEAGSSDMGNTEYETQIEENGAENVRCEVNFHSAVKYLSSTALQYARLENSFGSLAVYFTDCALWQHQAEVRVDISFASAELYIPSSWHVVCNVSSSFGGVNENGRSAPAFQDVLTITGDVSFGSLEIHYI